MARSRGIDRLSQDGGRAACRLSRRYFDTAFARYVFPIAPIRKAFSSGACHGQRHPKERQGQRLSAVLVADALLRAFDSASTVGSSMVVVDALDDAAMEFYAAHGFVRLPDSPRLVLAMRLAAGSAER